MNFNSGISRRITKGYFVILLIISITSIISIFQLEANKLKYNEISYKYLPTITYLQRFDALFKESNKLIDNWIRIANKDEKARLLIIQKQEYPALKKTIENFAATTDEKQQKKLTHLITDFDNVIVFQRKIMKNLETPENYNSDSLVDLSMHICDFELKPFSEKIQYTLDEILSSEYASLNTLEKNIKISYNYLEFIMISILFIIIIVGFMASYLASRSIVIPILSLKEIISTLGKGELPEVTLTKRSDEIGDMAKAIEGMVENIKLKTEFASLTGNGIYSSDFKLLGEKDILGIALIQMRNNLHRTAEEDAARNWINEGIAKGSEILRHYDENTQEFYSGIIIFISEYLNASIGALYLFNDNIKNVPYLELKATYAFELNNAYTTRILLGEGLAGQAAIEKKMITLKNIPNDYIKINSGLGSSIPKNILFVPLLFENELKGLIEIATINEFTSLQLEFIEKTATNIAITFDLASRKTKTELLLTESRELNDQLKLSQEKLTLANNELSTFVYKASHDLRGPLATMMGLINLALSENTNQVDIEYIKSIDETANKLNKILTILIKIMSMKETAVKRAEINFNKIIESNIQKLKEEEGFNRLNIKTNIHNKKIFFSDIDIISQILQNIIENTIKFQNYARSDSSVTIDVTDTKDGVILHISDNGVGIKHTLKNNVFEMFFRGNSNSSGSGLGLYFVKNAVNKLNGKIELKSEEGIGTNITIQLPSINI